MYFDSHAHYDDEAFAEDRAGILHTLPQKGVCGVINAASNLESANQCIHLAEQYDFIYAAAGIHGLDVETVRPDSMERLAALLSHRKVVAVGEIGLDYHYPDNPARELQKEIFSAQLKLADEAGLPVVVHSRDAAADTLELLKDNAELLKRGGLLHCYSYSAEMLREFAALGFYFSFGGTSTYKGAKKVQESVRRTPADRILTETDSPYLTPEPLRGSFPNEPKNVVRVLENLAVLREEKKEALEKQISQNAKRLFFRLKTEEL